MKEMYFDNILNCRYYEKNSPFIINLKKGSML